MLSELKISNFAIAENLDIEFKTGLSTITGETGAGKSIMIDALALALGARADSKIVGKHSDKAQIIASFDIRKNPAAQVWLTHRSLDTDDECILRRVITQDGKSKSFINGVPSPLQDVKSLAELLINIHSQHQHQALLKKESHRELLDDFCDNRLLLNNVQQYFQNWRNISKQLQQIQESQKTRVARIEFLVFQLEELDKLALAEDEFSKLNQEHKKLANVDQNLQQVSEALQLLSENDELNLCQGLYKTRQILQQLAEQDTSLKGDLEAINSALINVEESSSNLRHYLDHLEGNPERLGEIDQRLAAIHQIARKHHIKPEQICEFHQGIRQELDSLQHADQSIEALSKVLQESQQLYVQESGKLSQKRKTAAKKLDKIISEKFAELGMEHARIQTKMIPLTLEQAKAFGLDDIEILIATNPGQEPQALSKIASGGELSRISLAIQVSFAEKTSIPCLIFDEVDVGIGGATAEVVGRLLKELARHGQVICVTHLPQVAAQGQHHYKVSKQKHKDSITTQIEYLDKNTREVEIARMLGGVALTEKTQSHAKEMLQMAQ